MNAEGDLPDVFNRMRYPQLRIVATTVLLMTVLWAATRLLPSNWKVRARLSNQRTWPAVTVTLACIVLWFATSVLPYRQPIIVDGVPSELSILRVKKDGMVYRETRIAIYRDSKYYVARGERRLFHYTFGETGQSGLLTKELRVKLKTVEALPELKQTLENSPRALRTRHAEGWYTEMRSFKITAFTTENSIPPPAELVAFFREVEEMAIPGGSSHYLLRDVCLGFCYDPKAGLGDRAENQRCTYGPDRKEHCY